MVDINSLSQFFSSNEALTMFGFLGEYLAGKTLDKLSEAKTEQLTSKEFLSRQLLESLEDALRATCNEYGWIYDENAISATFSAGKNIWLGINSTERLISVLGYAIGNDYSNLITEDVAQFWIDAFDIEVACRQELHNYLHSKKNEPEKTYPLPVHTQPQYPHFITDSPDAAAEVFIGRDDAIKYNNRPLWPRNPALPPLRSEPEAPLPDTRSPMEHLEEAFRKYLDGRFEAYRKRNIEVGTPQLLSMALRYPENRALDILNFFDAGGKNSGPYGDRLMEFLESVDAYYRRKGRAYNEKQYTDFQERLRTWIGKIEPGPGPIPANTFTWFLLRFSDGQTEQWIKQELGSSYDTALSFIRDDRLPSFPTSFLQLHMMEDC